MRSMRELSPLEARVLGVLVEKERTVPDAYPLSLNALIAGCNQKTSRSPVMDASQTEVLEAIASLQGLSLVIESSGGRVMRYAQNVKRVLQIPAESVALLALLMLRGPQTAAELRANCERLCRFSDVSAVEAFLQELAARSSGPLTQELARQPGSRETRWMHCLCGVPVLQAAAGRDAAADLQVDVPDVVAEVRELLTSYERARAAGDVEALRRFFWESPSAMLLDAGRAWSGIDRIATHWAEAAALPAREEVTGPARRRVTTFGRDYASTSVSEGEPPRLRRESQVWVRLREGWRIVAAHTSETPTDRPDAAADGEEAAAAGGDDAAAAHVETAADRLEG
jgi:uncharacterized protein YceH (UPF0502 family)